MDIDKLLNYENECYENGFKEGLAKGKIQGHTEGRELGIQTGYQRYLSMGVLQARAEFWRQESHRNNEYANVDSLSELVMTESLENKPDVVEDIDRRVKLAKNKCRLIATARKSPKVDAHEQKIMYRREADDTTAIEDMY